MRPKFYPGWKMTHGQHAAYFNLLSQVYAALSIPSKEHEATRKQTHQRAFGSPISAKQIDHLKMFDAFKAECLAVIKPTGLDDQKRQIEMPRTRLLFAIEQLARKFDYAFNPHSPHPFHSSYVAVIILDRWGHMDPDRLTLEDLEQLRNTLAARSTSKSRSSRRVEALTVPASNPSDPSDPSDNNPF